MARGGWAVDRSAFSTGCLPVTPRIPGVVLVLSQACPQGYPQPVCTDCDGRHCYVVAHPHRACYLIRLVSSLTSLQTVLHPGHSAHQPNQAAGAVTWL